MDTTTAQQVDAPHLGRLSPEAAELAQRLDRARLPRHVAVIMDGNGRWARERGKPRIYGHRQGVIAVRSTVTAARILGIRHLTLYAFSMENWRRPPIEIEALMQLLRTFLRRERATMAQRGIRLETLGHIHELPPWVQRSLEQTKQATAGCSDMTLNLALSYGGRTDILDAVSRLVREVAAGQRNADPVSEEEFARYLSTAGQPDPDLLIRTSGEQRISNFLLWQISYAEMVTTPILWPDFRDRDFVAALLAYQQRERRFGGTAAAPAER